MAKSQRSIFEEVETADKQKAAPGAIDRASGAGARHLVRLWLMVIFALVAVMIAVGGMTRLTDSGLSITEWAPISGMVPPIGAAAWQEQFDAYKLTTEFQVQNASMTLAEFKSIFWWEWGHRQLGRVIGLVWALGFAYFTLRGQMPTGWTQKTFLVGVLIGVQGAIGWWMVASGLEEGMLDVASYRLAVHLGLAFVILGLIAWYVLLLGRREADLLQARRNGERRLFGMSTGLMHFAFLQIVLGALVAGIDAGRAFPTWPLMGDGFFPPDPFSISPVWRNFFEDAGLVQFVHRMAAYLLFVYAIVVWSRARKSPHTATRFAFNAVLAMMFIQVVLGIFTALYSAPVHIAIVHQVGAVLLWVLIFRARYLARYPLKQIIAGAGQ